MLCLVCPAVFFSQVSADEQAAPVPPQQRGEQAAPAEKKKEGTASEEKKPKPRTFALNFRDVELSEFITAMSQLIGKNVVIDERVKGKISITSAQKVPVDQAYDILKTILELKGFAVVETENLIKILPIKEAIQQSVDIIVDGEARKMKMDERIVTYLLELKVADANEVANALKALKTPVSSIVVYAPLNTIIFTGSGQEVDSLSRIARNLDRAAETAPEEQKVRGNIHVIHLENANAEQLAGVLSRVPFSENALINTEPAQPTPNPAQPQVKPSARARRVTNTQTAPAQAKSKLSIIANKDTNSLIITCTPDEFREISRIIKELDTVRDQVLIEALIIEVNAENGWGFGIDWMLGGQAGSAMLGGSSMMGGVPGFTSTKVAGRESVLPITPSAFQLGYLSDTSILSFALLNATGTDNNFKILSTPQIVTIDNQEAELNVGQEIPVATNNRISDTGTQFYTYEYKSVGVKMKITPHITNREMITLDLYQEVNSVLGQTTVVSNSSIPPTLGKRDLRTKVTVYDGRTIVVGGLIRNDRSEEETKVPVLGDIPLLGWFFKHKTVAYQKTNLLVFITPHIVTRQDRIDAITEQKRKVQERLLNRD